jgi:hypothetical protein
MVTEIATAALDQSDTARGTPGPARLHASTGSGPWRCSACSSSTPCTRST